MFVFPDRITMFTSGWQVHNQNSLYVVSKAGAIPGSSSALFLIPEFKFGKCKSKIFVLLIFISFKVCLSFIYFLLFFIIKQKGKKINYTVQGSKRRLEYKSTVKGCQLVSHILETPWWTSSGQYTCY